MNQKDFSAALNLPFFRVHSGCGGKIGVNRLQSAGHRIVHHHEMPSRGHGDEEIDPHNIAPPDLHGAFQQNEFTFALLRILPPDLDAGVDPGGVIDFEIIGNAGRIIKPALALTRQAQIGPFARIVICSGDV